MNDLTAGISPERQTLYWIRDQLWRSAQTTVSISPQEAQRLADEINAVLEGQPTERTARTRL